MQVNNLVLLFLGNEVSQIPEWGEGRNPSPETWLARAERVQLTSDKSMVRLFVSIILFHSHQSKTSTSLSILTDL